jgi:general secretion pathway protein D
LKASVQLLTGCLALGLVVAATPCQAAAPPTGAWSALVSVVGQFGGSDSRREADDLLRQARKAIKEGSFDQADGLIAKAEKLGVKYDSLTARFVDTPEKLRKLLTDERARGGAAQKPSSRFPALLPTSKPAAPEPVPQDPFADRNRESVLNQLTDDPKGRALSFVKQAREALAAGDKFAAMTAYQKALAQPVIFGPEEDSPQRLAAEMARAGIDVSQLAPAPTNPASPYTLRPSDIPPPTESLPLLPAGPNAAAQAVMGQSNPYNMPAETNPLIQAAPGAGGAYQPTYGVEPSPAGGAYQQPAALIAPPTDAQQLPPPHAAAKADALRMVAEARMAMDKGDLRLAKQIADQAQRLNVPETAYGPEETRPWQVLLQVEKQLYRRDGVMPAAASEPVPSLNDVRYPVTQGVYNPSADATKTMPAASQVPLEAPGFLDGPPQPNPAQPNPGQPNLAQPNPVNNPGQKLYDEGLKALESQDRETAIAKFSQAWRFENLFDPETRQQLKDKLTFLRNAATAQPLSPGATPSPLEQVNSQQEVLRQKLVREISSEQKAAEKLATTDPREALLRLKSIRDRVAGSEVDQASKKQLLLLVDRSVSELETYIKQNAATIENKERNDEVRSEFVRSQEMKIEMQNKLAKMVEQFNVLMEEQRFPEAEVIAKQANEMMPREPVVTNMVEKSRLARGIQSAMTIRDEKERGFRTSLGNVDLAAIPGDDNEPYTFNAKRWDEINKYRKGGFDQARRLSPAELEIQKALTKPVEVKFENRPLAEVADTLGRMTGVNIYLDPQGLHAEGVVSDTPVTLNLSQPIALRSALNLLLEPLGLSYVIQNEVLRITSEQTRDSDTYVKTYYVADLVMPIPNFVPSYNIGLPGALRESLNSLGYGGSVNPVSSGPLTIATNEAQLAHPPNKSVLAQMPNNLLPSNGNRMPTPAGGPGGMGGGVMADFDSLIELITTTIAPQSWDEVGGPGSVSSFDTNLSLVVSQTQEVHERITDLLEQLRRLQDLQVTIEVRFITLSDRFFERIGVNFNFAIDDNTGLNNKIDLLPTGPGAGQPIYGIDDNNASLSFGLTPAGTPTANLDIPFTQNSFASSTPQFGSYDANSVANFGFAILSDIEVFFVLQAGQGDDRTNVLQAPKVTLFNGQQAFVSDTSQRPFVTSVIPVVGDFAAAHQPVIVVLNEGTSLSVQAVVSSDRRFVRLTLVPFFSKIGDVETFTFNGSVTTNTGTVVQDPSNPAQNVTNGKSQTVQGTTVQLPTFAFTTVTTTVSVPDGGTVLLGGIKRLRESRNERGVPLLSKVPYISRLFKNVGIGRDAQSLMMMVTPRIIIQEEEEAKLGIDTNE